MKINTNRLEPRTARPNWVGRVEGKDIGGQATARIVKNRIPWILLWKKSKKKGMRKKGPTPEKNEKSWNSPAIRRRWTSWSSFRAIGWSHGSVFAQARNSSWVHLLKRARKHSWPIGKWCRIFNMSNSTAIGTENNTSDCNELTILNSVTDQTGMSSHGARNRI